MSIILTMSILKQFLMMEFQTHVDVLFHLTRFSQGKKRKICWDYDECGLKLIKIKKMALEV